MTSIGLSYELGKKLEEAGYEGLYTLSELVEACGNEFYELANLGKNKDGIPVWQAKALTQIELGLWRMYRGSTPEEAVARLWFALNSGDTQLSTD